MWDRGDPAVGAALCTAPAHADQAADPLKRLNLLGRWANDCADATRTGVSYEIDANGSAFFINVVGTHRILSAASSDGRNVTLTIRFLKPTEEVRINAFRMISANTYVPTMNRNEQRIHGAQRHPAVDGKEDAPVASLRRARNELEAGCGPDAAMHGTAR